MNTIRTVADLKKALSAYPDDLEIKFMHSNNEACRKVVKLNNDTQICQVSNALNEAWLEFETIDY